MIEEPCAIQKQVMESLGFEHRDDPDDRGSGLVHWFGLGLHIAIWPHSDPSHREAACAIVAAAMNKGFAEAQAAARRALGFDLPPKVGNAFHLSAASGDFRDANACVLTQCAPMPALKTPAAREDAPELDCKPAINNPQDSEGGACRE